MRPKPLSNGRPRRVASLLALATAAPLTAQTPAPTARNAPPATVEAPIRSVALFKNGLAVVRRAATLPGEGTFELAEVPEAAHGTFWVDAATPVDVSTTRRVFELPADGRWEHDPAGVLGGRAVSVRLRGEPLTEVQGKVVVFEPAAGGRAWDRAFEAPTRWNHWALSGAQAAAPAPSRFLALDTDAGRVFVDQAAIVFLRVIDPPTTRREERPVLRLTAPPGSARADVTLSYLAKGLSFAPSYRLDIADPRTLVLSQTAVVRNELEDLTGVEVELISGFPSMEYSHVLTPLSPDTTWAGFFAQVSQELDGSRGNRVALGQNVLSNYAAPSGEGGAIQPASEGVDLHYHSIGVRDLREGDAMHVHVATAEAAYERIVDWRIPDSRDEWGRPIQRQPWEQDPAADEAGAWDALRFDNPFGFPMTTAPATIVSGRRFQGQRTTSWVNPGEETTVRITKALAVRTTNAEYEVEGERELVVWGGHQFRKVGVKGEVQLCNHRKEVVKLVIRREFSGELVGTAGADPAPEVERLERGVYSVNRRQQLVWTLTLQPGEERLLEYTYDVLVMH